MTPLKMSYLASVTGGVLHGPDAVFQSVSTDTRSLESGQLFVALRGPNYDGNRFIATAAQSGASGALVQRLADDLALPQVVVADTRLALGQLARAWRQSLDLPLIAVTGSNGKTTIKEMIASIMGQRGPVLATRGNLNNEIGVPLTLLEIEPASLAAVIELGANHPGEIDYLARLAMPTIGVVSNAGPAHLEGFGSLEGVARAKGELFQVLGPAGVAVMNADDNFAPLWRDLIGRRQTLSFGIDNPADFFATGIQSEDSQSGLATRFLMHAPKGEFEILLPFAGTHNVRNALAAAAAAWAAGADQGAITKGLAAAHGAGGRLQVHRNPDGVVVIDDTYNANPGSLAAALEVQSQLAGEAWLVLGDMGELGSSSTRRHADAGAMAREQGVTRLFATGEQAKAAVEAFGSGGEWFKDADSLIEGLQAEARPGAIILVKASRSMRFERIVNALLHEAAPAPRKVNGG